MIQEKTIFYHEENEGGLRELQALHGENLSRVKCIALNYNDRA